MTSETKSLLICFDFGRVEKFHLLRLLMFFYFFTENIQFWFAGMAIHRGWTAGIQRWFRVSQWHCQR